MYGCVIGDLSGSIYEYEQTKKVHNVEIKNIIEDNSFYSDDTILTIAVLEAILNDKDYDKYLRKYIRDYSDYKPDFKPYFKYPFSPNTMKWSRENTVATSAGNGAMMRISPVGYMFDTEEEVIENAKAATIPSHNTNEAIESATKVALIIFYLRKGLTLKEIYNKLNINVKYTPFAKFNYTCSETIDNCLYVLQNSTGFEDAIKKAIYLGGDTDTNAAIVGSMAEALYGINPNLIKEANKKLPDDLKKILQKSKYYK